MCIFASALYIKLGKQLILLYFKTMQNSELLLIIPTLAVTGGTGVVSITQALSTNHTSNEINLGKPPQNPSSSNPMNWKETRKSDLPLKGLGTNDIGGLDKKNERVRFDENRFVFLLYGSVWLIGSETENGEALFYPVEQWLLHFLSVEWVAGFVGITLKNPGFGSDRKFLIQFRFRLKTARSLQSNLALMRC